MKPICLLVAHLIFSVATVAADTGWHARDGKPLPNTDAQKSINGFGGALIVTPDKDWEEKWNTPAETTPEITTSERLRVGETLTILIVFSNAKPSAKGFAQVLCDLRVVRPNKTISLDAKKVDCFTGPIVGDPFNVRLTNQWVAFKGESSDVLGQYTVFVTLYDNIASIAVPLKATFTLAQ